MNIRGRILPLGLLALCAAANLQAADLPFRGPIPFDAYDSDGNGAVSEAEFNAARAERVQQRAGSGMPMRNAGNAPVFSAFDSNGDGQLSRDELAAGQRAQMGQRGGMGPGGGMGMGPGGGKGMGPGGGMGMGPGSGRGPGRNMPAFADYDLNGDGSIGEQEFYEARGKRIGERAQQGYAMRNLGNAPAFGDVDSNGNGTIDPAEFAHHQQLHFQQRSR